MSNKSREVVIVGAVRTPIGRHEGSLKRLKADQLGSIVIKEVFINQSNISSLSIGAPARSRTQNLLVRSQALYPIELQAHFLILFNYSISIFSVF